MLVTQAAVEAAVALSYLDSAPMDDVLDLQKTLSLLLSKVRVYIEVSSLDLNATSEQHVAGDYFSNAILYEIEFAKWLASRISRYSPPFTPLVSLSGVLRDRVGEFGAAFGRLKDSLGSEGLFDVDTLRPAPAEQYKVVEWMRSAENVEQAIPQVISSYAAARGVADGWADLAIPLGTAMLTAFVFGTREVHSHSRRQVR